MATLCVHCANIDDATASVDQDAAERALLHCIASVRDSARHGTGHGSGDGDDDTARVESPDAALTPYSVVQFVLRPAEPEAKRGAFAFVTLASHLELEEFVSTFDGRCVPGLSSALAIAPAKAQARPKPQKKAPGEVEFGGRAHEKWRRYRGQSKAKHPTHSSQYVVRSAVVMM